MKNQKQKNKESVTTIPQLAKIMLDSFQVNQDLFIGEIGSLKEEMRDGFVKVNENFRVVKEKIDNISLNIVDVVRKEDFDKLETRVVTLETKAKVSAK